MQIRTQRYSTSDNGERTGESWCEFGQIHLRYGKVRRRGPKGVEEALRRPSSSAPKLMYRYKKEFIAFLAATSYQILGPHVVRLRRRFGGRRLEDDVNLQ